MPNKKKREADWFSEDILPHETDLRNWLSRRYPTLSDIDDVIQETFFKLLRAYNTGPLVNPRAYLFVTAKNLVMSRFRHQRYEKPNENAPVANMDIVSEMKSPLEETISNDEVSHLVEAIEQLPERCCQVITMRKIYGFSQLEVSRKLGISVNTVQNQTALGVRKVGEYFRKMGYRKVHKQ